MAANDNVYYAKLDGPVQHREGGVANFVRNEVGAAGVQHYAAPEAAVRGGGVLGNESPLNRLSLGDTAAATQASAMVAGDPNATKVYQDLEQAILSGNGDNIDGVMNEIDQFNNNPAMQKAIMEALNSDPAIQAQFPGLNIALSGDGQKMLISGGGAALDGSYDWNGNWNKYEPTQAEMLGLDANATDNGGGGGGGGGGAAPPASGGGW